MSQTVQEFRTSLGHKRFAVANTSYTRSKDVEDVRA